MRLVPTVLGLLPPRVDVLEDAEYPQSPAHITAALDSLSPGERATLNSLVRTGGDYFSPAPGDHSRASTLAALESAGLIRGVDKHRAHVPRAVADALAGRTHRNIPLSDPLGRPRDAKPGDKPSATKAHSLCAESGDAVAAAEAPADAVAAGATESTQGNQHENFAATGQGLEATRLAAELLENLGRQPASLVRSGGIAVRELRRLAHELRVSHTQTLRLISALLSSQLIGVGYPNNLEGEADTTKERILAPTDSASSWAQAELPERWAELVYGWAKATLAPWQVTKNVHALHPDSFCPQLPAARAAVLRPLAQTPPGTSAPAARLAAAAAFDAPLIALNIPEPAIAEALDAAVFFGCAIEVAGPVQGGHSDTEASPSTTFAPASGAPCASSPASTPDAPCYALSRLGRR